MGKVIRFRKAIQRRPSSARASGLVARTLLDDSAPSSRRQPDERVALNLPQPRLTESQERTDVGVN